MHFLWEILQEILQEIFKICKSSAENAAGNSVENVAGNAVANLAGNGFENNAVFSLNTWLRTIYCLQTIHKPACVILTLFQFFKFCSISTTSTRFKVTETHAEIYYHLFPKLYSVGTEVIYSKVLFLKKVYFA